MPEEFRLTGQYRTQSFRNSCLSTLAGHWDSHSTADVLDAGTVNAALAIHPLFCGNYQISLRAAVVTHRTGAFCADDALYYRHQFIAEPGTEQMAADILDVPKLINHWQRRQKLIKSLFVDDEYFQLVGMLGHYPVAGINEYLCHEVGHAVGWNIDAKYSSGYFRLDDRVVWPLIYMEEFRADTMGLHFACDMLGADRAASVFIFQLFHRFGLAAAAAHIGSHTAGMVPFLLFSLLRNSDVIRIVRNSAGRSQVTFQSIGRHRLVEQVAASAWRAAQQLTVSELDARTRMDVALNAAGYYRACLSNEQTLNEYMELFNIRGPS